MKTSLKQNIFIFIHVLLIISGCAISLKNERIQTEDLKQKTKVSDSKNNFFYKSINIDDCNYFYDKSKICYEHTKPYIKLLETMGGTIADKKEDRSLGEASVSYYVESGKSWWPLLTYLSLGVIPTFQNLKYCLSFSSEDYNNKKCADVSTYYSGLFLFVPARFHVSSASEAVFEELLQQIFEDLNRQKK